MPTTSTQGLPRREDEEIRLDERIRSTLSTGPEEHPADEWRGLREHARLPLLYPGQFVAFRDHHEGERSGRRLTWREVLHVAANLEDVQEHVARLPKEEQQGVEITYVE
jgi:hypothetical protein